MAMAYKRERLFEWITSIAVIAQCGNDQVAKRPQTLSDADGQSRARSRTTALHVVLDDATLW
jgi:hypothetical protein